MELEAIEKETRELNEDKILETKEDSKNEFTHVSLISQVVIEQLNNSLKSERVFSGLSTGFREVDSFILGLKPSELIAVFAKPYMGLSSFGMTIALNTAILDNSSVALFSMGISKEKMCMQMMCAEARVDFHRFNTGYLIKEEWERIGLAIAALSETAIFIDDKYGLTIQEIRNKLTKLLQLKKIDVVIIDNLQHISENQKDNNKNTEISKISRDLKGLAKEFDIPFMILCQLPLKNKLNIGIVRQS